MIQVSERGVAAMAAFFGVSTNVIVALLRAEFQLPPAARTGTYGEPWQAIPGGIIAEPGTVWPDTMQARENRDYYGGDLIAESMQARFRDRAIECVNFCSGARVPLRGSLTEVLDLLQSYYVPQTWPILRSAGRI